MSHTLRIAYFSPLAPSRASTSEYSEELLPHLCRRVQVDAYTDDRVAATQEVGRIYPLYGYRDFQRDRYDQLIFQLADSPEHLPIYDLFLRFGGVAMLHDLDLAAMTGDRPCKGNGWGLLWEVRRNEGVGPFLRSAGGALLRGQLPPQDRRLLSRRVQQQAMGLIVGSEPARARLLAQCPHLPVRHIPMGIPRPPLIDSQEARSVLGLPQEAFICLSLGRLDPEKRIHVALQAFARLLDRYPNALYVLVGEQAPEYPLREMAQALGIAEKVHLTGYVERATLYRYLAACDAGICLRSSEQGELSAGLLRMMSMGKPVIVSNREPYAGLPEDCTLRVDVGAGEMTQITAALWALSSHPPMRPSLGRRAAQYVQTRHSLAAAAQRYVEFLEELATVEVAHGILLQEGAV